MQRIELLFRFSFIFSFLILVAISSLPCPVRADNDVVVSVVPNQFFHEDGDPFSIEADLSGSTSPVDFYLAIEIEKQYYFFPNWTLEPQHISLELSPSDTTTIPIIPMIQLPTGLPKIHATLYCACTRLDTYDLISNLEIIPIFLQNKWTELPEPNLDNTFHLMPGDKSVGPSASHDLYQNFADTLYSNIPLKGPYMRLGISMLNFIDSLDPTTNAEIAAEKSSNANLALGLHVGFTNHHITGLLETIRIQDRRNNQWESNGEIFENSGDGDLMTICPSRYISSLMDARKALIEHSVASIQEALEQYSDTLVFINGPIEVEMRRAFNDETHYADYSPFSVAEFRDWLRHTGEYSDSEGIYRGQGVPRSLIDNMDFSADPSPIDHIGPGLSFNEYFGTNFSTWNLLYWDTLLFPQEMTFDTNPIPNPGETGYTAGGFDAPRMIADQLTGGNNNFHAIWDGYFSPTTYGFRQVLIHHYVSDNSQWFNEAGLSKSLIYTHQIPADYLGNWIRHRGSASPFWTSWNPYSRMGYTMFFDTAFQESLFSVTHDLSPEWGIFEYHPAPFMDEDSAYFLAALELVYRYRCHIICPLELRESWEGIYQFIDTPFETAFNQFFAQNWPESSHRRFDQPFTNYEWIDYTPPQVSNVQFSGSTLTWNSTIWASRPDISWETWGEFDRFEIFRGDMADFQPTSRNRIATTRSNSLTDLPGGFYKVIAFSKLGLSSQLQ